ncbi:MAG: endonuclease MutS2, partial [Firmicutes bacterium]|nr:endonuclease MutS2 [Bacillota bacterium]
VCSRVWADIGDEQSIAQSLSTFSSHMTNIVKMLEGTDHRSLILFDELGAGTDPVEGAALAASIIERSRELGALVAATTHYAELKVYAMTTPGVQNASCEFDVETLAPTYRLIIGIPGKSNAFAISRRLGLPEEIIQKAAERIDAENIRFEDVLTRLDEQRQALERERASAAGLRQEMEAAARKAARYQEEVAQQREKAREAAQVEAQRIIDEAREASDEVFQELKELRRQQSRQTDWQETNDRRAGLRHKLNEAEGKLGRKGEEEEAPPILRPAVAGDTVELLKMGTQAVVLSVNKEGILQLQAGILRVSARQEEVRVVEGETQSQKEARQFIRKTEHKLRSLGATPEVDLRGMTTDEAEAVLSQFLDQALLGNLTSVRIIHGKGTGAVRKAVHQVLKRTKQIKSFRLGRYGEGEDGVTIAELK